MKKSSAYKISLVFFTAIKNISFPIPAVRRIRELFKPYIDFAVQYENDIKEIQEHKISEAEKTKEYEILSSETIENLPHIVDEVLDICEKNGATLTPDHLNMLFSYEK